VLSAALSATNTNRQPMTARPTIVLVGADKGGVGKTMTCRVLLDYLARRGTAVRVFDSEWPNGNLQRFAAEAAIVDIAKVTDQMRVFDGVAADALTVVDIRAGLLSPTIKALDEAHLLDDVRAGAMELVLLHVLGDTVASIAEITRAAEAIGTGARHFLVKNKTNADQAFDWDTGAAKAMLERMADVTIDIPALPAVAAKAVDERGGPFAAFVADDTQSRLLRGRVRTWLEAVWREFDRVKVIEGDTP